MMVVVVVILQPKLTSHLLCCGDLRPPSAGMTGMHRGTRASRKTGRLTVYQLAYIPGRSYFMISAGCPSLKAVLEVEGRGW